MIGSNSIQKMYETIIIRERLLAAAKKAAVDARIHQEPQDSEALKALKASIVQAVQQGDFGTLTELTPKLKSVKEAEKKAQIQTALEEKKAIDEEYGLFVSRCKQIRKVLLNLPRPLNMIIMLDSTGFSEIIREMGDLAFVEESKAFLQDENFTTYLYVLGQKNGQPDDEQEADEEDREDLEGLEEKEEVREEKEEKEEKEIKVIENKRNKHL